MLNEKDLKFIEKTEKDFYTLTDGKGEELVKLFVDIIKEGFKHKQIKAKLTKDNIKEAIYESIIAVEDCIANEYKVKIRNTKLEPELVKIIYFRLAKDESIVNLVEKLS